MTLPQKFLKVFGLGFSLLLLCAAIFLLWASIAFQKPNALQVEQFFILEKGVGVRELAQNLESQNIISSQIPFLIFAVLTGEHKNLQAGEYLITPKMPMAQILNAMAKGKVFKRFVTIPEGKTSVEIIRILNRTPHLIGEVLSIPAEGSLLPDTYAYTRGESKQNLINRMQKAMDAFLEKTLAQNIPPYPLQTRNDILTLASIVEKETGMKDERRKVAGVFINRLNKNMRLETDPTVIYGLTMGHHEEGGQGPLGRRLLLKDLQTPNPYNTYLNQGLPPTPIANAGKASILAVLNPEPHNFLFFVADGTGGHAFAENYNQHLQNVERWRAIRATQP